MLTYSEAQALLGRRDRRKLANNTYLERRDEQLAVRLHATDVVTLTPDYAELHTGGWYTVTTKERLNRFSPARVYSERGRWYVSTGSWSDWKTSRVPYFDGIRVGWDGQVLNPEITPEADAEATREANALKRRISAYAKLCVQQLQAGLPQPGGGDCWYCLMRNEEGTLGDLTGDPEHLLQHIEESYVVPALLANAVAEAGYQYPGVVLHANEDGTMGGPHCFADGVRRAVVKYLKRRLISTETGARPVAH